MTRPPCPVLVVAASLLAIVPVSVTSAAAAAIGDGGFGDPVRLGAVPATAQLRAALPAGDGATALVLADGTRLQVRGDVTRPATQTLGTLGTAGAPVAAADRAGVRLLAWWDGATVQAAVAPAGGAFGAPQAVGPATRVSGLDAAIAGDGTLLVVYGQQDGTAAVALSRGGAVFGTPQALPTGAGGGASGLRLAAGADGTAVAVWQAPPPAGATAAALAPGAAAFGAAEAVPLTSGAPPSVAVLPSGEAVLATDGRSIARRAPGGGYATAALPGADGGTTDVAVADDGTLAVVVSSPLRGVRAWVAPPGRPFGAPVAMGVDRDGLTPAATVWSGGAVAVLDAGAPGEAGLAETAFFASPSHGLSSSTLFGPVTPVVGAPGATPGSFDAYATAGGSLYRLTRPRAPSHGTPRLTFGSLRGRRLAHGTGTTSIGLTSDRFGTASVVAVARSGHRHVTAKAGFLLAGGAHRATLPAFLPARVSWALPASARPCHGTWSFAVTVRLRDRAGDAVRRVARFAARCR